jgi:transposase
MQVEILDATVINHIDDIAANYELRIQELQDRYEHQIKKKNEIIIDLLEYQNKYLEIKERYDLLIYKRFMRSAERLPADANQPLLFAREEKEAEAAQEEEGRGRTEVKSHSRKKPGRKPLDPSLPREEITIDIPEDEKTCACGEKLTRIGEETSERLEIIPERIVVKKTVRPKYACRHCGGTEDDEERGAVRIAPVEPSIIPRSIASPSLLSWVFTHKFEDHLPYYRQEKQFERIGVEISRQDMCNWQQQAYGNLSPLFAALKETVKSGPVLQMDETTVQVIREEGRDYAQKSYMWLARGGPVGKTVVWYEYHPTRAAYNAKAFLEGYCGYLQTDGYKGYDAAIEGNGDIIHVGCFAHARRKFFEASKAGKAARTAEEGIKHIRRLYHLEDELRSQNLTDEAFLSQRKAKADPILNDFKKWLMKREPDILPSSLLGTAIEYTLKQWDKMTAYLESPYLTPDNNACENAIRPFVLGRKNWLFSQSPEGAESSCGIYTLIETARQNGLVAAHYLTVLFEKAPYASSFDDWEKLLPWNIFTA